eukprot:gene11048-7681_t
MFAPPVSFGEGFSRISIIIFIFSFLFGFLSVPSSHRATHQSKLLIRVFNSFMHEFTLYIYIYI